MSKKTGIVLLAEKLNAQHNWVLIEQNPQTPGLLRERIGVVHQLVSPKNGAKNLSLTEVAIETKGPLHRHQKSEEICVIIRGAGEVFLAGKITKVALGDCVIIPPGVVHAFRKAGGMMEQLVYFCILTPAPNPKDDVIEPMSLDW
ncbi:MAG: cupin domain-containing protein [Candidatus Buchananbacteria bacterium]